MANISPGVYTKITDLSTYVAAVPSTIGFIPLITPMGPDNQLIMTNGRDFIPTFGKPNINYMNGGKSVNQGMYVAANYLTESGSLYVVRCLPTDATYSNLAITLNSTFGAGTDVYDANGIISLPVVDRTTIATAADSTHINAEPILSATSLSALDVTYTTAQTKITPVIFYAIGRGDYYNDFAIKLTKHLNPVVKDVYILTISQYQKDPSDPDNRIMIENESFQVSFNPEKLDAAGDSLYIEDVVNLYSKNIRVKTNQHLCSKIDKYILDTLNNPLNLNPSLGWHNAFESYSSVNGNVVVSYVNKNLQMGSVGELKQSNGDINIAKAENILVKAYTGVLEKTDGELLVEVQNTDDYYITIVLDGGYSDNVKTTGLVKLCDERRDCFGVMDNGDNHSATAAKTHREGVSVNTKYVAIYEGYSKIYDVHTGRDIWITPVYHMAKILPYTDNVTELWYAPAGFNRAMISSIKELRYSPILAERDAFYLVQLNPIVKFNIGYTVYSQLTSQAKPSALQDVNIVRLILYIQRALQQFCRFYLFEFIDSDTFTAIRTEIDSFLKQIQNKRGLYGYGVNVHSDEYNRKLKRINVDVTLTPARVAEQINLNFFIK